MVLPNKVKYLLIKLDKNWEEFQYTLQEWRNTPSHTGYSPSQIFVNQVNQKWRSSKLLYRPGYKSVFLRNRIFLWVLSKWLNLDILKKTSKVSVKSPNGTIPAPLSTKMAIIKATMLTWIQASVCYATVSTLGSCLKIMTSLGKREFMNVSRISRAALSASRPE